MVIEVPQELEQLVRDVVLSGRYRTESEVVAAALQLLQQQEQQRQRLKEQIEAGMQGEGIPAKEAFEILDNKVSQIESNNK